MVNKFSEWLSELLKDENITNRQLTKAIDVSESSVGLWVREERQPTAENIYNVAKYFGVTSDFLLGLEDLSLTTF